MNVPLINPITVFDAGITAGCVIPIGGRLDFNIDVEAGLYRAMQNKSYNSIELGVSASFNYKIRPFVGVGTASTFSHFIAPGTPFMNGISISPSATFNLTEVFNKKANLKMETKEILPVYPVLYSWYEKNRFATVTITNEENAPINNIKVSFYQPQYMGQPKVCAGEKERLRLGAGKSVDIDLTAFFNERMLEMTEKSDTQATVTVEYTCMGEKRTQEFPMIIPVYGRNSMSWVDDRRAAVFVSSKDPAAMLYSKYVTSVIRENLRIGVPENIQYALGIFDSLAEFGINYVIDPSSAYTDNVGTETPDFLQFPYQTLSYRGGDCDDLSILVCSLFEAVGIDTAFITIPGHIYMAFNLGLNAKQTKTQFGSLDNFIVIDNEVWIPLEITVTDEGFDRAWQIGAREWRTAARTGEAALYKMKDSWEIYKPVSIPGAEVTFTMPEKSSIAETFSNGVDTWILREIEDRVDSYKKYIADTGDVKAQNTLGAIYGRYGLFDLAEEQLENPLSQGYIPSLLNKANVQFAKKNYEEAKQLYRNVLRKNDRNAAAYIGIARCCYELEQYTECDLAYQIASMLNSELSNMYAYLGAFENTKGRAFNLADRLAYTVWVAEDILGFDGKKENKVQKSVPKPRENPSYVGLPNQISIMTADGKTPLKQEPEEKIIPEITSHVKVIEKSSFVEKPNIDIVPKIAEMPKVAQLPKESDYIKVIEKSKPIEQPKVLETPSEQIKTKSFLKIPRLKKKGYYVQIGVYEDSRSLVKVYNKYKNDYSIVGLEEDDTKILLVGPFDSEDSDGILNDFKSFGFKNAFVQHY